MAKRRGKHLRQPTAVRSMHAGNLPSGPVLDMLLAERANIIGLMNALAADLHVAEPLSIPDGHDGACIKAHTAKGCGWKFAYAQRIGETVMDAVTSVRKQYLGRLRGCMLHCDTKFEWPPKDSPDKLYRYVPENLQDTVTEDDFAAVKSLASDGGWQAACRAVSEGLAPKKLTPIQAAIVAECHAFARSRYRAPVFNRLGAKATDGFVVQLRPDERTFIGYANKGKALFEALNAGMQAAWEENKPTYGWPLVLTAFHGDGSFTVPVVIDRRVWDKARRDRAAEISGVMLEIGPTGVEVRATIRRPLTTPDIASFSKKNRRKLTDLSFGELAALINSKRVILARDVNLVNTLAHGLILRDADVTPERLRQATFMGKDDARAYLETHFHPCDNIISTTHFCGRDFLGRVADLAKTIDKLRSRIDNGYTRLEAIRGCLAKPLGLNSPDARIDPGTTHEDPFVQHLIGKFFHLLSRIRESKALRLAQYRKIDAIKKCWFGWVTNREAELAVKHDAVVVREDTDFIAIPRDDPKYRGRAFNRLMNNGCRGMIERMASAKLAWLGILEVKIPSFFTSSTDTRHSAVDKDQRDGHEFTSKADGRVWHADEHSTETIGNWLLLRPVEQHCL